MKNQLVKEDCSRRAIYFHTIEIGHKELEVPAQAGWFEGDYLQWIHSMRYKPAVDGSLLTYQPELLNEKSNKVLADLADGTLEPVAAFHDGDKYIISNCRIESKRGELRDVSISNYWDNSFEDWDLYPDYYSFYYPTDRIVTEMSPDWSKAEDVNDSARGSGWAKEGVMMFSPVDVYFALESAATADLTDKSRDGRSADFFENLLLILNSHSIKLSTPITNFHYSLKINNRPFYQADRKVKASVSLIADFIVRLSRAGVLNLNSPAVVLIENSGNLIPELFVSLFPRMQFIVA